MQKIISELGFTTDAVAYGTYGISAGEETYKAVSIALELGYRSVDTAKFYNNEKDVGRAVRDAGLEKQVQITTKVWNDEHGYKNALAAGRRSRDFLGVDGIGLLLIHWPGKDTFVETWEAFEELKSEGTVYNIGVSNFNPSHLKTLKDKGLSTPVVNQIELNPLFSQKTVREYCNKHFIIVEGWRPVVNGDVGMLADLKNIADTHNKTVTQIALRWSVQIGCRVLPKSVRKERMIENIDIFDFTLSEWEMSYLNDCNKNYRTGPDPDVFF